MLDLNQETKATASVFSLYQISYVLKGAICVIKEFGRFGVGGPAVVQLEGHPDNAWFYAEFFPPFEI